MKEHRAMSFGNALPLPAFVLHPVTALVVASLHVYLAAGHLLKLFDSEVTWTNIWKGFGALAGAYVFAALASRGLSKQKGQPLIGAAQKIADADEPIQTRA
jgi:hypothetical protein